MGTNYNKKFSWSSEKIAVIHNIYFGQGYLTGYAFIQLLLVTEMSWGISPGYISDLDLCK